MKNKLRRWSMLLLVVFLATGGSVFYYLNFYRYIYHEEKPDAVRMAEVLLAQVTADERSADIDGMTLFNADGVDGRMLTRLREKIGGFWREPGETVVSVGTVFAQNPHKRAFSEEPYVQRVLCVHATDRRTEYFWVDYQPAVKKFVPRVWVNGRLLEEGSAPAQP